LRVNFLAPPIFFATPSSLCPITAFMPQLTWLEPGDDFPEPQTAWGEDSDAPGLLAAGASLDTLTLIKAYSAGIFPWFSEGQPTLWWSPNPRMVLKVSEFRLHDSFRKVLRKFSDDSACEIKVDFAFDRVIAACASAPRKGQSGTWIVPDMVNAYLALHRLGYAHSIEAWQDEVLIGGLYCVSIGTAIFGESMFAKTSNASKCALAALVCICREFGVALIDCQQNTRHLASLGAAEVDRSEFLRHIACARHEVSPPWSFSPLYWNHVLSA